METTIRFGNGKVITVQQNGSSYIVPEKPDFPANLKNIHITNAEGETVIENGEIIECAGIDNQYWFTICEIPASAVKEQNLETRISDIEDTLCELSK